MRLLAAILIGCLLVITRPSSVPAQSGGAPTGRISFMIFGDPADKAAYENFTAAFKKKVPTVAVELIHIPNQGAYRRRLTSDFVAGAPPDVMLMNYSRYAAFARRGQFEPLDSYLAQSKLIRQSDFYQEALAPFLWGERLMCLPQNVSSLVVYYNKKLFDEANIPSPSADWSWDEFLQTAKALTRNSKGNGVVDQFGLGTQASMFRVAPFIWQNGGQLVDRQPWPTRLTIMTEQALQAIQWFVDLRAKHKVMPDAVAEKAESSESRFQNGRLGMYLNSRARVPTFRQIRGFEWDVAPLPHSRQHATILHSDGFCMAAKSTNKDAAWALIEFAMSVEGQTILAATGRTVPSLKSVANSPVFVHPNAPPESSRVFLDVIPAIRSAPIMDTWADVEETFDKELERAMNGQTSVHQAVATTIERTFKYFED
jgi:multiple sugar transport system substrate-binding protein